MFITNFTDNNAQKKLLCFLSKSFAYNVFYLQHAGNINLCLENIPIPQYINAHKTLL